MSLAELRRFGLTFCEDGSILLNDSFGFMCRECGVRALRKKWRKTAGKTVFAFYVRGAFFGRPPPRSCLLLKVLELLQTFPSIH